MGDFKLPEKLSSPNPDCGSNIGYCQALTQLRRSRVVRPASGLFLTHLSVFSTQVSPRGFVRCALSSAEWGRRFRLSLLCISSLKNRLCFLCNATQLHLQERLWTAHFPDRPAWRLVRKVAGLFGRTRLARPL